MPRHEPPQLAAMVRPMPTLRQLAGGTATSRGDTGLRSGAPPGECGSDEDLEGEPSPWETRAAHRWKRRWVATDSSAEQGPEVNCSTGAALTEAFGNGRHRRRHLLRCGRGVGSHGFGRRGSPGLARSVGSSSAHGGPGPSGHGTARGGGGAGRFAGPLGAPGW